MYRELSYSLLPLSLEGTESRKLWFRCSVCGEHQAGVVVRDVDYDKWIGGDSETIVKSCFPYLGPEIRELFISGTCPRCQKSAT